MPLRIRQRKESEVPAPGSSGKINPDLQAIRNEMSKLASGMVLEIEAESERAVRSIKMMITRSAGQLGTRWRHWSEGSRVYARPAEAVRRRVRRKAE